MLTGTTTRRCAAVLMVALVAMLLVATGGSARAAQARTAVGTGHASAAPQAGRHAAAIPPAPHDQSPLHLDLASTAAVDRAATAAVVAEQAPAAETPLATGDRVATVGRGPPAP